jgi:hypothetical protein
MADRGGGVAVLRCGADGGRVGTSHWVSASTPRCVGGCRAPSRQGFGAVRTRHASRCASTRRLLSRPRGGRSKGERWTRRLSRPVLGSRRGPRELVFGETRNRFAPITKVVYRIDHGRYGREVERSRGIQVVERRSQSRSQSRRQHQQRAEPGDPRSSGSVTSCRRSPSLAIVIAQSQYFATVP